MSLSSSILYETQEFIKDLLNSDCELSSSNCKFLSEDSKTIEFDIKNNIGKQGIIGIVTTPKADFQGHYSNGELTYEIEVEIDVVENVQINRNRFTTSYSGQKIALRCLDVLCTSTNKGKFSPINYEQGEDSGLLVNKIKFKCLLVPDYN